MSEWIKDVLLRAEELLTGQGENYLAGGIRRLKQSPHLSLIQLYQHEAVEAAADAVLDADSNYEFHEQLAKIAKLLEVEHCTVHLAHENGKAKYDTKVITTYSRDWAAEYVRNRFSTVDPVLARCRDGAGEFHWDELAQADPFTKNFYASAYRHGVGLSGFSLTTENKYGDLVSVTVSARVEPKKFRVRFRRLLSDFRDLAPLLIDVFTDLNAKVHQEQFFLAEEHFKILYCLAKGKTREELEGAGFLFGSFHGAEKEILRQFNAKNLTQATAIAAALGLMRDFPFLEDEIHTDCAELSEHLAGIDRSECNVVHVFREGAAEYVIESPDYGPDSQPVDDDSGESAC